MAYGNDQFYAQYSNLTPTQIEAIMGQDTSLSNRMYQLESAAAQATQAANAAAQSPTFQTGLSNGSITVIPDDTGSAPTYQQKNPDGTVTVYDSSGVSSGSYTPSSGGGGMLGDIFGGLKSAVNSITSDPILSLAAAAMTGGALNNAGLLGGAAASIAPEVAGGLGSMTSAVPSAAQWEAMANAIQAGVLPAEAVIPAAATVLPELTATEIISHLTPAQIESAVNTAGYGPSAAAEAVTGQVSGGSGLANYLTNIAGSSGLKQAGLTALANATGLDSAAMQKLGIDTGGLTPTGGGTGASSTGKNNAIWWAMGPLLMAAMSEANKGSSAAPATAALPSPKSSEYFNRPTQTWDWNKIQGDAQAQGTGLGQFAAQNLPALTTQGQYVKRLPGV